MLKKKQKIQNRHIDKNFNIKRPTSYYKKMIYIIFAIFFIILVLFFNSNSKYEADIINKSIKSLLAGLSNANVSDVVKNSVSQDYISYLENIETASRIRDFFIFSICVICLLIFIIILDNMNNKDDDEIGYVDISNNVAHTSQLTTNRHKRRYHKNFISKK